MFETLLEAQRRVLDTLGAHFWRDVFLLHFLQRRPGDASIYLVYDYIVGIVWLWLVPSPYAGAFGFAFRRIR